MPKFLILLFCLWSGASLCAQGRGHLSGAGLEPEIAVSSRAANRPSRLELSNLLPSPQPSAFFALSPSPDAIDLSASGLVGASIGLSLGPGLLLSPQFSVPATGELALPFLAPNVPIGQYLHVQLFQLDPSSPAGLTLSDSLPLAFGPSAAQSAVYAGPLGGPFAERILDEGGQVSFAPPFAQESIQPLAIGLAARQDPTSDDGRGPVLRELPGFGPALRFPSGLSLVRGLTPTGLEVFRASFPGRDVTTFDLPALLPRPLRDAWSPLVGASPFAPYACVVANEPIAALQGVQAFLLRTDGANVPGTASPVLPLRFTGALAGFSIDEESPTFLAGALLFSDGDAGRLARVPLAPPFAGELVPLPSVQGAAITELDAEFAWSRDGQAAVLSGGLSETVRDLLLVRASGPAINLTQWPGAYQDVSYGDLDDGETLAISPDASHVAFVREFQGSQELFLQEAIVGGRRFHLSPNALFEDTIETLIGLYFYTGQALAFRAGQFGNRVDAYRALVTPQGFSLSNVTATSGVLLPPFDVGASLAGIATNTSLGGGLVYTLRPFGQATDRVALLLPNGLEMTVAGLSQAPFATFPFAGRSLALVNSPFGGSLVDLEAAAGPQIFGGAALFPRLEGVLEKGSELWLQTGGAGGPGLLRADQNGAITSLSGVSPQRLQGALLATDGALLVFGQDQTGAPVTYRVAPGALNAVAAPSAVALWRP